MVYLDDGYLARTRRYVQHCVPYCCYCRSQSFAAYSLDVSHRTAVIVASLWCSLWLKLVRTTLYCGVSEACSVVSIVVATLVSKRWLAIVVAGLWCLHNT